MEIVNIPLRAKKLNLPQKNKRTRRGAGGRWPPNFGEFFKNQPFSGKLLPFSRAKMLANNCFVSGRPLDFFVPHAYAKKDTAVDASCF